MKIIDECIDNKITSKDIRDSNTQHNIFLIILSDELENYEKGELRKNKIKQLYQNKQLYKIKKIKKEVENVWLDT